MTDQSFGSWSDLFGGTAFIDPNDFGPLGYAALPALLLVFERVCVYSPYPPDYVSGVCDDQLSGWLNLSWEDFESFAIQPDPALQIVARPDYTGKADLQRASHKFRDQVQPLQLDQFEANAQYVLDHPEEIESLGILTPTGTPLPPRYQAVYDNNVSFTPVSRPYQKGGPVRLPVSWSAIWKGISEDQRVRMVATYDCKNDHIGITAANADRPFLSIDHLFTAKHIFHLQEYNPALAILAGLNAQDPVHQFVEILRTALPMLVEIDNRPVTRDAIQRFRDEQQVSFWRGFDELSHRVSASRPEDRIAVVQEWARNRNWAIGVPSAIFGVALGFFAAAWLPVPLAVPPIVGALIGFRLGQRTPLGRWLGIKYCGSKLERILSPVIHRPTLGSLRELLAGAG